MQSFTIVAGLSGSGKTTYARSLGAKVISFDRLFDYRAYSLDYEKLSRLSLCGDDSVVIDGIIPSIDPNLERLSSAVAPRRVEIVFIYTTLEHQYYCERSTEFRSKLVERFTRQDDLVRNKELAIDFIQYVENLSSKFNVTYLFRLGDRYEKGSAEHFLSIISDSANHEEFAIQADRLHQEDVMKQEELEQFIKKEYEGIQPYQTVEYKGKIIHRGTERCWQSWENISKLGIVWYDKKVCDVGSYFGYFSTKVLSSGAAEVVAIDRCEHLLDVCSTVLKANGFSNFRCINKMFKDGVVMPDEHFDVLLALNVLHHIKAASGPGYQAILDSMFSSSDDLIFEINESEMEDVINTAKNKGHIEARRLESHRNWSGQRWIMYFKIGQLP